MKRVMLGLALAAASMADETTRVTHLMTKELKELSGKEATLISVSYAPGAVDANHRHHAHTFVYVLEGSVVMQVEGQKEKTLGPGETLYEAPGDRHVVGRNASTSKPAKFLVFFVKDRGAPILVPSP